MNPVSSIDFKCDQCEYTNIIEKDKRMKHRMSQVYGVADSESGEYTTTFMNSMKSESEHENIDKHNISIPLEKLKSLTAKNLLIFRQI